MDDLILYDKTLFLYLNSLGTNIFDFFWIILSSKVINFILYFAATFLFYKNNNFKSTGSLIFLVCIMIFFTDQTTNLFKEGISRLRPCHDPFLSDMVRLVKSSCGGLYGYFSAHASNSFALAIFFGRIFKNGYFQILFFVVAFLIGYSRIYLGVHYPLDVISGAIYGVLIGLLFYKLWEIFSVLFKNALSGNKI